MKQQRRLFAMHPALLYLTIGLLCLILGFWFWFGTGVIISGSEYQDDKNLEVGIWSSGQTFEQTFLASRNNLSRVDFFLDSYHPWDVPYLECSLYEVPLQEQAGEATWDWLDAHSEQVRYKRINGWLLSGHMFNQCSFEPITDSQGKYYVLSILAPEVRKGGSSILLASPEERYERGRLFVDGEPQRGDLAFRVVYRQPRAAIIQQVCHHLALQKPALFSTPVTYYVLFSLYIAGVLVFLSLLWSWTKHKR